MMASVGSLGLRGAIAVFLTAAAVLGVASDGAQAQEITVLTWAGAWEQGTRAVIEQFEKQYKIKVNVEIQENARIGLAKIKAQRSDPEVDVWFSVPDGLADATNQGLLQSLPMNDLPTFRSLPEAWRHGTWIDLGNDVYGFIYRKDLVPFEPKTLDDLLDTRLQGKILGPTATYATGFFIVYAALQHGGNERNVEPGFEYLRRLKPNIASFVSTGPFGMKQLQTGQGAIIAFTLFANLRPFLDDPSYKFVLPAGPVLTSTYSAGITSSKHRAQALKFIDFLATPEAQTLYCASALCIPTNPVGRAPKAAEEFRPDPARLYQPDLEVVNKSFPSWAEWYQKDVQTR
jgi:putative spermidine/putrescine transport system substrate-binding protein